MRERRIRQSDLLSNIYGERIVSGEDPTPRIGDMEMALSSVADSVTAILLRMTLEERRVFQLRFGLGGERSRTFAEIAEEIGQSPTTARRRLNSALHKFSLR